MTPPISSGVARVKPPSGSDGREGADTLDAVLDGGVRFRDSFTGAGGTSTT